MLYLTTPRVLCTSQALAGDMRQTWRITGPGPQSGAADDLEEFLSAPPPVPLVSGFHLNTLANPEPVIFIYPTPCHFQNFV